MGESRELLLTIITRGKPQVESLTVFEAYHKSHRTNHHASRMAEAKTQIPQ